MKKKKVNNAIKNNQGISLIETLFAIAILAFISLSLYTLFDFTLRVVWENKARAGAAVLANQYIEQAYNLAFLDVGTEGGIPSGSLPQTATTTLNDIEYTINTAVIYIDDPFDGTQGSTTDDLLPTDYKQVRVEVSWNFRLQTDPIVFVSYIAPKGLESELGGGTLRITALDSQGIPVPQAQVTVINNSTTPVVNLSVQSNDNGQVILPGATSSIETYQVRVTKAGYSMEQTYAIDPVSLPIPAKPHLSVLDGEITDASFAIDQVSAMHVTSVVAGDSCSVTQAESEVHIVSLPAPQTAHRGVLEKDSEDTGFHIAAQEQIYVDGVTGDDTTGDGSSSAPYATIVRALQDIDQGEGDVLNIAGGQTYTEGPLVLDTSYSGATSTPTIIRSWIGTATPTISTIGDQVFVLDGIKHLLLTGFAITNAGTNAIEITGDARDVTVSNNLISGNTGSGVVLVGGGTQTITSNTIIANGGDGISVESSINTINENLVHANTGTGIVVTTSTNDIIQNVIYSNAAGIDISSSNNLVTSNEIYSNTSEGIHIYHSSGQNTITNNTLYSNGTHGLFAESTGSNILSANESFSNTGYGMYITSASNTLTDALSYENTAGGVYINSASNALYDADIYDNGGHGIELSGTGNTIQDTTIRINDLSGISMSSCSECSVFNSMIYSNLSHGIHISSSDQTTFLRNRIYSNNGRGLYLVSSDEAFIDHNFVYRQGSSGVELSAARDSTITANTIAQNGIDGISLGGNATGNVVKNNIVAFNGGRGLDDEDDNSEPDDSYNLFFSNTTGDLRNLTPSVGGTGSATGTDPLFINIAVDDYHLQSVKGYYPFGAGDVSAAYSPAIDAGDPTSAYTDEPASNGCRVNLGAYGNTSEASKSPEVGDPVANLPFTIRGAKTIGLDASGDPVYKFDFATSTDAAGQHSMYNLEWDSYTLGVNATSTGYDIAYIDPYQPMTVLPNTTVNVEIGLMPDSQHSLHILVIDTLDGLAEENADVRLYNVGLSYDETKSTASHGQVFFDSLTPATYSLEVTKGGFQTFTSSVIVDWYTDEVVSLTP